MENISRGLVNSKPHVSLAAADSRVVDGVPGQGVVHLQDVQSDVGYSVGDSLAMTCITPALPRVFFQCELPSVGLADDRVPGLSVECLSVSEC